MRTMADLSVEEKKELYREVVKNWGRESVASIAERLNIKPYIISGIASRLRKVGIALPKLGSRFIDENLMEELKKIFNERYVRD